MRRLLLALITALLVARPLVLGEDPGLLDPLSGTSGLWLSVLWLTAGVGWAAWRVWSPREPWQGSVVETALAGVVTLAFLSTLAAASYQHPAWLISWEWLILLLAFVLVRQLGVRPRDHRALLAALVASGVSLGGHALYQYALELPQLRQHLNPEDLGSLQRALASQGFFVEENDPQLANWAKRILENNVFATFVHPNAFAGYLALLFPVAVGWSLAARRQQGWSWQTGLSWGAALLVGTALWLTHSRGALLAICGIGVAFALVSGFAFWWKHKLWVLAALLAGGSSLILVLRSEWASAGLGKNPQTMAYRLDYWQATWHMILDHPWLGVGPGNFGRLYPKYMLPTAFEKVSDPHNWLLEIWVTCGGLALVALLTALGAFFWRMADGGWQMADWPKTDSHPSSSSNPPSAIRHPPSPIPWEFYLGGMAGLVMGFLARATGLSPDEMVMEATLAGGRSLLWFLSFAVLNSLSWSGPSRALALAAGIAALLFNSSVSGGISFPSLAQPLWVLAALALNALPGGGAWERGSVERGALSRSHALTLSRYLPLVVLAALWLVYVVFFFAPVSTSAEYLNLARRHYGPYFQLRKEAEDLAAGQTPASQREILHRTNAFLRANILKPLAAARRADPQDSIPLLELATWQGEQAKLNPGTEEFLHQALNSASLAQELDPENKEGYLAEYRLHLQMAQQSKTKAKLAYGLAAKALEALVERDPTEARWRYLLAEALFQTGDPVKGRLQAERAWQADQLARAPSRQLSPAQREQVRQWLTPPS